MISYANAWFEYFRADSAADDAIAAYRKAYHEDGPEHVITARAYDAAIMAMRKSIAAENLAEAITDGSDSSEMEDAVTYLRQKADEVRREAEREIMRRARLRKRP